ncbi:MAG: hypothetical protein ACLR56_00025 [Oscillospiraceae bacterium]
MDMLNIDGDLPLIIGLLLILFSEKADKKLLLHWLYSFVTLELSVIFRYFLANFALC